MKKSVLGLIFAIVFGTASFANEKVETENSIILTEESEAIDSWMTDLSSWKSSKSFSFEVDIEEDIELEVWMINLGSGAWNSDQEEDMAIEDWMTKIADNSWGTEETEEDLTLEDWMLNPSTWIK